jgi:hypothetical protein
MKALIMMFLLVLSIPAFADVYVNSYQKDNGTTVPGHYRSNPDGDRNNNYSTEGNTNPYNGREGNKPRDNSLGSFR